ncbi:MAG: TolC family outer membrane protein [Halopseudomonas sp.]
MKARFRFSLAALAVVVAQTSYAGALQEIYQQALDSDPQLKTAQAVFNADREVEEQGRSALLPSLQLSADTTYTESQPDTIPDGNSYGYQLDLSQAVFRAEEWFNFQAGKTLAKRAEVAFSSSQQFLIRRTVEVYLEVLRAQTVFATTQSVEAAVKRRLDQVQAQFDVGLIAITDVEESRASYDSARVARIIAQGELDKSFEGVDRLTGQNWTQLDKLSNRFPIQALAPAEFKPWVDKALDGNLQLQLAQLDVESAEQTRQATRSRHLPTIDLVAGYGTDHGARSLAPSRNDQDTGYVGLNLSLPLYLGGRTSSQVRETSSRWDAALQQREDIQRGVVQDTRSLYRDLMTDVESVAARKQSIVSTETALEAVSTGYSVGTRNIVDVLQAERALYTAIEDYQVARYLYVRNLLRFKESVGTLNPDDIQQLDQWMVKPGAEPPIYQKKESTDQG